MAKGVLGNDPFRRSAAPRAEAVPPPQPAPPSAEAEPRKAKTATKPAATPPSKGRAAGTPERAKTGKDGNKKATRKEAPSTSAKRAAKEAKPRAASPGPKSAASVEGAAERVAEAAQAVAAPAGISGRNEELEPTGRTEAAPRTGSPADSELVPPSAAVELEQPSTEAAAADEPFSEGAKVGLSAPATLAETERGPEGEARPVEVEVPLSARAVGALALARDILLQTLDRPGLKRLSDLSEGLMLAVRTGLGIAGGGTALDPYGKDPSLTTRLEPLFDFLFERYWRVTVENAAALPSGPAILVANHAGALPLDGPVLALAVSRERPDLHEARWLVEDQIFHAPFWGTLLNRLGAIRASPENALRLLEEQRPVLVFPEGVQGTGKGYRERYRLKRFGRGGFVKLALRTGAPIVPVAIVGSEEATPMLAKLPGKALGLPYLPVTTPVPLPVRWAIRFGAPIHLTRPEGDELAFVQQLTERTRGEIETMIQSLLRERSR